MPQGDLEYFTRRLEQELAEAKRSTRGDVRQVHTKMAELYRARIDQLRSGAEFPVRKLEVEAVQAVMQRA